MDWIFDFAFLAILFPVFGLLINVFLGQRLGAKGVGLVACLAAGLALAVSLLTLIALLDLAPLGVERVLYDWAIIGNVCILVALRLDPLSVTMMLVVSGVGLLIHVYAVGYMRGDPRWQSFFVYFNLSLASMLLLVMANNYLMLFIGWELVGLCAYLLVGFWSEDPNNSAAGKNTFVVNLVGDAGLLLGILLISLAFGTLDFAGVFEAVGQGHDVGLWGMIFSMKDVATAITLLLFLGAMIKSAHMPVFVWLRDAMVAPMPAVALICAATVVTAGVYVLTRSAPLLELADWSADVVAIVGALTALLAAAIAVAQFDIKRVLAYGAISQLGFMVAAVGLGGHAAATFHLLTYACFSALLFLGAGSVIRSMKHGTHRDDRPSGQRTTDGPDPHDPQDMRNMGGLGGRIKWTFAACVVGWLALAGVFPLAGFWSRSEILAWARNHNPVVAALLTLAAFVTAFYVTRLMILVFDGDPRTPAATRVRESGNLIITPLVVLAVLSLVGGALCVRVSGRHTLAQFLDYPAADLSLGFAVSSTAIALLGILCAWAVYSRGRVDAHAPDRLAGMPFNLFTHLNRAWHWDRFYSLIAVRPYCWLADKLAWTVEGQFWHDFVHDSVLVEPFKATARFLANPIDQGLVDGIANKLAGLIQDGAGGLRKTQTGYVRNYALWILLGVAVIVAWLVFR